MLQGSLIFSLSYLNIMFHVIHSFQCHYKDNPLQINGTQTPNTTRCPDKCSCLYCLVNTRHLVTIRHDVECSKDAYYPSIPSADIPVDVKVLVMNQNRVTNIKGSSLVNFKKLEILHLSYNELYSSVIDDNSFDNLKSLERLYMDFNRGLTNIPKRWFRNLRSLQTVSVEASFVKTIEKGLFENCDQLQNIILSGNMISKLPIGIFHNLPLLQNIDLHSNDIGALHNNQFLGSPNVLRLFVQNNKITTVSENVGLQKLRTFIILGIQSNPLVCDCNLVWFRNWISQTNVTILELEHTTCKNKNGTSVLNFDADSLRCYDVTTLIIITTCSPLVFVAIVGIVIYVFRWDIRYWNQRRLLRKQYERLQEEGPPLLDGVQIRYDAFVSYNSKDRDWVLKSALPVLEGPEFNFRLCVDFRDFMVGETIADNISDAIKYSRKMLVVVTKNFAKSEWCYFELEMARNRMFDNHEEIFVVVILEHVPSRNMPTLLQKILRKKTYIEWTKNPDGQRVFWTRLAAALNTPNAHHDRLIEE